MNNYKEVSLKLPEYGIDTIIVFSRDKDMYLISNARETRFAVSYNRYEGWYSVTDVLSLTCIHRGDIDEESDKSAVISCEYLPVLMSKTIHRGAWSEKEFSLLETSLKQYEGWVVDRVTSTIKGYEYCEIARDVVKGRRCKVYFKLDKS